MTPETHVAYVYTSYAHAKKVSLRIPDEVIDRIMVPPQQAVVERNNCVARQSLFVKGNVLVIVRCVVNEAVDPNVIVTTYESTRWRRYWKF